MNPFEKIPEPTTKSVEENQLEIISKEKEKRELKRIIDEIDELD
jgi:hypothetical protein